MEIVKETVLHYASRIDSIWIRLNLNESDYKSEAIEEDYESLATK